MPRTRTPAAARARNTLAMALFLLAPGSVALAAPGVPLPPAPLTWGDDTVVHAPGGQVQVSVAAHPARPGVLAASALDWASGSAQVRLYFSRDAGTTWSTALAPAPQPYANLASARVAVDAEGCALLGAVAFRQGVPGGAVLVAQTCDHGGTWLAAVPYASNGFRPGLPDVAVGPRGSWAVAFLAPEGAAFLHSPDGGATWTTPLVLGWADHAHPDVAAGLRGDAYVAWRQGAQARVARISLDHENLTAEVAAPIPLGYGYPGFHGAAPSLAVVPGGPHRGRVVVAGPAPAPLRGTDVVLAHTDDGTTWSSPESVAFPGHQLGPALAALPDGTLGVFTLDLAADPAVAPLAAVPPWAGSLIVPTYVLRVRGPQDTLWSPVVVNDVPAARFMDWYYDVFTPASLAAGPAAFHPAWRDARLDPSDFASARVAPRFTPPAAPAGLVGPSGLVPVNVASQGDAEGGAIAVSLDGDARGAVAVAPLGNARGLVALSGVGDASGAAAVAVVGDAAQHGCLHQMPAMSLCLGGAAVSGVGDSHGSVAVSGVGHADGEYAVLCRHQPANCDLSLGLAVVGDSRSSVAVSVLGDAHGAYAPLCHGEPPPVPCIGPVAVAACGEAHGETALAPGRGLGLC